jgi:hypothetical protein
MTSHQEFKDRFISQLAKLRPGSELHYRLPAIEQQYGVESPYCEELLFQWAHEDLIDISAWDGEKALPWHLWPSAKDLFHNTTDAGHVRIKLLAAGAEYAEHVKKREIGLVTGA